MYGSCNVLVYITVAVFRLNGVEELHSPINQVQVEGGVWIMMLSDRMEPQPEIITCSGK